MMRKSSIALSLLVTGCATSQPGDPGAAAASSRSPLGATPMVTVSEADAEIRSISSTDQDLSILQQIEVRAYDTAPTSCEGEFLLGSRLAAEHCYADEDNAIGATFRRIQRQEYELMRQRRLLQQRRAQIEASSLSLQRVDSIQ